MTTYAVTAATGQLGRLAVEGPPAARGHPVRRRRRRPHPRQGRGPRRPRRRRPARGTTPTAPPWTPPWPVVDRLLLVSGSEVGSAWPSTPTSSRPRGPPASSASVYTSLLRADTSASPLAPRAQGHEEVIRASGLPHVLLRNSWYYENYHGQPRPVPGHGRGPGGHHDGRISAPAAPTTPPRPPRPCSPTTRAGHLRTRRRDVHLRRPRRDRHRGHRHDRRRARRLRRGSTSARWRATGLDAGTAGFVAALDASIANGDLQTDSTDSPTSSAAGFVLARRRVAAAHTAS